MLWFRWGFGLHQVGNATFEGIDMPAVNEYKDGVVARLYKGLQGLVKSRKITFVQGMGRLVSPTAVEVDGVIAWANTTDAAASASSRGRSPLPTAAPGTPSTVITSADGPASRVTGRTAAPPATSPAHTRVVPAHRTIRDRVRIHPAQRLTAR